MLPCVHVQVPAGAGAAVGASVGAAENKQFKTLNNPLQLN